MRKVLSVLAVGTLVAVLASCGGSSSRSFVRIVNASPDAGAITVTINGNSILSAAAYGTGSNYFTVAPGATISLKITGATAGVIDTKIALINKAYYTIAAVGSTAGGTFTILQTEDDHTPPAANDVKIRVLQLDPLYHVVLGDNGPVDAYITTPIQPLNGRSPNFSAVTFQSTPGWVSVTVPADGNLKIRVAPGGDSNPDGTNLQGWNSQIVLFKAGQVRTYLLLNNPTGTPFSEESIFLDDLN